MKTTIGAAVAALSLAVALPALADQAPRTSAEPRTAQAAAQGSAPARNAPAAQARQGTQHGSGMMSGQGMTGQGMTGHGMMGQGMGQDMPMDMSQMMASCPCCRMAMQGQAPKPS